MQIEEFNLGATSIKFFDDYIEADKLETIKDNINVALSNAIEKMMDIEKL